MVERLFLTVTQGCLRFVKVVFPDHTHLLFFRIAHVYKFNVLMSPTIPLISLQSQGFYAANFSKHYTIKQGQALYDTYFPVFKNWSCI